MPYTLHTRSLNWGVYSSLVDGDRIASFGTSVKHRYLTCLASHGRLLRRLPGSCKSRTRAILAKVPDSANRTATTDFTAQEIEILADCEAANTLVPDVPVPACPLFVVNLAPDGKVHKVGRSGPRLPHYLWRAACSWPFARHHADYDLTDTRPTDRKLCAKCFKLPKTKESDEESSTSSSSSTESCAPQIGSDGQ